MMANETRRLSFLNADQHIIKYACRREQTQGSCGTQSRTCLIGITPYWQHLRNRAFGHYSMQFILRRRGEKKKAVVDCDAAFQPQPTCVP